jgi:hypothetical protein
MMLKVNFIETCILLEFYQNQIFPTIFPLLKTFLLKPIFTTGFRLCIFKTDFLGIRLTSCSTVLNFLSWRYLRFYPFVDCTKEFFCSKFFFSCHTFVRRILCVVFSFCMFGVFWLFVCKYYSLHFCFRFVYVGCLWGCLTKVW